MKKVKDWIKELVERDFFVLVFYPLSWFIVMVVSLVALINGKDCSNIMVLLWLSIFALEYLTERKK